MSFLRYYFKKHLLNRQMIDETGADKFFFFWNLLKSTSYNRDVKESEVHWTCHPQLSFVDMFVLGSFVLSPSVVKVPGADWTEPVLAWLTVSMPTGSGKSTLFRHLYSMMQEIRVMCGITDEEPTWVFDDAIFEKMGALMSENSCPLLGFYDHF